MCFEKLIGQVLKLFYAKLKVACLASISTVSNVTCIHRNKSLQVLNNRIVGIYLFKANLNESVVKGIADTQLILIPHNRCARMTDNVC